MAAVAEASLTDQVAGFRDFNRFFTNEIGLLRRGLLDTPYSLTEARVLYELSQAEVTETKELRERLDVDRGYLSRILARFEEGGYVRRGRSEARAGADPAADGEGAAAGGGARPAFQRGRWRPA
jgi:CRP-like cAMP-binding protein